MRRDGDADEGTSVGGTAAFEAVAGAVELLQTRARVTESDAFFRSRRSEPGTAVPHFESQHAVVARRADVNRSVADLLGNAMNDRVLDNRLENQARHECLETLGRNALCHREAFAEPETLDGQIAIEELQLSGERDLRISCMVERSAVERSALNWMTFAELNLRLPELLLMRVDKMGMGASLEARVPFLDHRVVEYAARVPSALKVKGLTRKYLLKQAARGLVPDRIVDKRKLGFFRKASTAWLHAQLPGAVSDYLLGSSPHVAEFLDRPALERLIAAHRAGSAEHVHLLISILMLEIWLASYVPRATAATASGAERIVLAR